MTHNFSRYALGSPGRFQQAPEKDVFVQEQLHRREVSHSCSGTAGETMSPIIFPVLLREPSQDSGLFGGGGGMICAIGSPLPGTRDWRPVPLTFGRSARQSGFYFLIDTFSFTGASHHGSRPKSTIRTVLA